MSLDNEAQKIEENAMKTILSTLLALSVLAGIAVAPASAYDSRTIGGRDVGQSSPL